MRDKNRLGAAYREMAKDGARESEGLDWAEGTLRDIEGLIDEAVASGPPEPWTKEDWSAIRREVHRRYHKRLA